MHISTRYNINPASFQYREKVPQEKKNLLLKASQESFAISMFNLKQSKRSKQKS